MKRKSIKELRPELEEKLRRDKELLKIKIDNFLLEKSGESSYHRRLDKLYDVLKNKFFIEDGDDPGPLYSSDLFQRVESMMSYTREVFRADLKTEEVDEFIFDFIGQVFKSVYSLIVLAYLEDKGNTNSVKIPYLGEVKIKEFETFDPGTNKVRKNFVGHLSLSKDFKDSLRTISDNQKFHLIVDSLKDIKKTLVRKVQ